MDYEAYMKFLLRYQEELNLPYSFAMKLSFIGSPLLFGKAMLIFNDDPYEIVGAAGFVYGTGANNYEDRHVCQIEIAFLRKEYRGTLLFQRGLQALTALMKSGEPAIEQVQFWVSADQEGLGRLFSKFLDLPDSTQQAVNQLSFYRFSFHELEAYVRKISKLPVGLGE
ncbi:hypothetical protein [Paenibacillus nasutitermitis]|nr:hypothetical protein [Paenibacillus nasutitermitis]